MSTQLTAAAALALWLQNEEPAVFAHLLAQAQAAKATQPPAKLSGFGDWSSILSSLGTDLSSAVTDVGNYLSSSAGQSSISGVVQQYLSSNNTSTQGQVLQTQVARAANGQAPAAIGYALASNGTAVPVYTSATLPSQIAAGVQSGFSIPATTLNGRAGVTLTPAMTAGLAPSGLLAFIKSPVGLVAGAAAAYLLLRRRAA